MAVKQSHNHLGGSLPANEQAKYLAHLAGTGVVIKIAYRGGSQPGAVREVIVHRIRGPYLYALCLSDNRWKTFRLDRLKIVGDEVAVTYQSAFSAQNTPQTSPTSAVKSRSKTAKRTDEDISDNAYGFAAIIIIAVLVWIFFKS